MIENKERAENLAKAMQQIKAGYPSLDDARRAYIEIGKIAHLLPMIPMKETAAMGRKMLWDKHGPLCLLRLEWWRWLRMELSPNAEAQLPPERPQAAEGTQSAPALCAVNCSDLLGGFMFMTLPRAV